MVLDGDKVAAGDSVYDVAMAESGTVARVTTRGDIEVRFSRGRIARYGPNGMFAGVKRLYWHNPVIEIPRKNDRRVRLVAALLTTLRTHLKDQP